MTPLEYKVLGLLARKPMSGYDVTQFLKQRFVPFGAISHTQIYPALAGLEQKGLVRYYIIDQQAVRPNKKVYELTEEGRATLREWVESPTPLGFFYGDFFLKAYSLWLADPEQMIVRFREQAELHEEQRAFYEQVLAMKQQTTHDQSEPDAAVALTDVLFHYLLGYEQHYGAWCQRVIEYLEQQRQPRDQNDERTAATPSCDTADAGDSLIPRVRATE